MKTRPPAPAARGFTLIELLLALAILASAFAVAFGAFTAATRAWQQGTAMGDALNQGDLVLERLVASLRSAAYFPGEDPRYGFHLEEEGFDPPATRVSWVTSGPSFLPADAPLARTLHRVEIALEPDGEDGPVLIQRAWPHLIEEPDEEHIDTRVIARGLRGFGVRIFDEETDDWSAEWERTNTLPRRVEITLQLPGEDPNDRPVEVRRLVEIPLAAYAETGGRAAARRGRR